MSDVRVRCTWMRGGTSKGLVFRRDWLEGLEGAALDRFLLRAMGSPDPHQIDGLGGAVSTASKVMIVEPNPGPTGRIEYQFAQVSIDNEVVDYGGNCGNMTSAVAAFAVNEAIAPSTEPVAHVKLHNVNTMIDVDVEVPTAHGRAAMTGPYSQAGVPRPGPELACRYLDPSGSVFDSALPTGSAVDALMLPDGTSVEASIVDVSNPLVFVRSADIGIAGTELPAELNQDQAFLRRAEDIRAAAAVRLGLVDRPDSAMKETPGIPKLAFVAEPTEYTASTGATVSADEMVLLARIMSMQRVHLTFALTGIMCSAASTLLPGTIPAQLARLSDPPDDRGDHHLAIGHPGGTTLATVGLDSGSGDVPRIAYTGVSRTARLLMEGWVHAVL